MRAWFVPWCVVLSTPERLLAGSFMFYITITLVGDCVFKKEAQQSAMKSYTMRRQLTTGCGHLSVAYAFGHRSGPAAFPH
jgi:hypothetical protein